MCRAHKYRVYVFPGRPRLARQILRNHIPIIITGDLIAFDARD